MTSLSKKLEQDDFQKMCQQEVEDLHHVFVAWFLGKNPKEQLTQQLKAHLQPTFSHVAPNGRFLRGRKNLIAHLDDKYGCYEGRLFTIDIYAVRLIWTDGTRFLCMYEEWQSWEQEEDTNTQVNQFGRLSSCLLEKNSTDGSLRWVHVHETWLEDEAPETPAGQARRASWEEDTVMTGPQEEESEKPTTVLKNVSESEKRLLVLISNHPLSKEQVEYQELAYAVLDAQKIPYDTLDGADPESRTERNELFKTSRVWGKYPQFFLQDTESDSSGKAIFWGDPVRFKKSVDNGTLKKDLGLDGESSSVAASEDKKNGGAAAGPPVEVLVLISRKSASMEQAAFHQKAFTGLQVESIPYSTVDGSDPAMFERRNELFALSQSSGEYPQFFVVDKDGTSTFWGNRDRFDESIDNGSLKDDFDFGVAANNDWVSEAAAKVQAAVPEKLAGKHVIFLMSKLKPQPPYEQPAQDVLTSHDIPFEEVDGSDKVFHEKRGELFKLSGKPDVYPQLFIVQDDGTTTFWGDIERFNTAAENGTVKKEMGFSDGSENSGLTTAAVVGGVAAVGVVAAVAAKPDRKSRSNEANNSSKVSFAEAEESDSNDDGLVMEPEGETEVVAKVVKVAPELSQDEQDFMNASAGILEFEEDEDEEEEDEEEEDDDDDDAAPETPTKAEQPESMASPIPQDISKKRHISPKLEKYAKPLTWENTLVGISISGFDIGTSQGPMGDELWYREMGDALEQMAQSRSKSRSRRKLCLPEMVFPTAHVAIEGHGIWLSWDVTDAMEEWAKAHREIALHSNTQNGGVQVLKVKDAALWEKKQSKIKMDPNTPSRFHYDWTYSTPFCGKLEGGHWSEIDESGMRLELLTDQSVPILFFDEVILFEDDLHDNGQAQFSVKLRVMPSCAFILARYWLRVDDVVVRVRETRVLVDFFGLKPSIFRDVTWRECWWDDLRGHGLPGDVKSWTYEGRETPEWASLLKSIPEAKLPDGVSKYAVMEIGETNGGAAESGMLEL